MFCCRILANWCRNYSPRDMDDLPEERNNLDARVGSAAAAAAAVSDDDSNLPPIILDPSLVEREARERQEQIDHDYALAVQLSQRSRRPRAPAVGAAAAAAAPVFAPARAVDAPKPRAVGAAAAAAAPDIAPARAAAAAAEPVNAAQAYSTPPPATVRDAETAHNYWLQIRDDVVARNGEVHFGFGPHARFPNWEQKVNHPHVDKITTYLNQLGHTSIREDERALSIDPDKAYHKFKALFKNYPANMFCFFYDPGRIFIVHVVYYCASKDKPIPERFQSIYTCAPGFIPTGLVVDPPRTMRPGSFRNFLKSFNKRVHVALWSIGAHDVSGNPSNSWKHKGCPTMLLPSAKKPDAHLRNRSAAAAAAAGPGSEVRGLLA